MTVLRTRPLIAVLAVVAVVATACNDDGREMRSPGPDKTLSIITTTSAPGTDTLPGFDTFPLDTLAPVDSGPVDSGQVDDTAVQVRPGDEALDLEGFDVAMPWPDGGTIDARFTCDGEDVSPPLGWAGLPENTTEIAIVVLDGDASDFIHWIVAGIDPSVLTIQEGALPTSALVGTNSGGLDGWTGPCPPAGETHTYTVEVHALDQQVELPPGSPADEMLRAIDFATIARARGTGTYTRA